MPLASRQSRRRVAASDSASRLPLSGWSTERGDLRIAHFVGLHAIQGLLLAGLALGGLPVRWGKALVLVVAVLWLLAVLALAALAIDGRSPFGLVGLGAG